MVSFEKMQMSLLIGMVVCLGATSCQQSGRQRAQERLKGAGSEAQTDMKRSTLSREKIIEAANAAARQHGWLPERSHVIYDEGNAAWKSFFTVPVRAVEGHDYQVVKYVDLVPRPGGDLWIAIDRHSGAVLRVIETE